MAGSGVIGEWCEVWCSAGQLEGDLCAGGGERCGGKGRLGPDISGCRAILVVEPRVLDQCSTPLVEHGTSACSS